MTSVTATEQLSKRILDFGYRASLTVIATGVAIKVAQLGLQRFGVDPITTELLNPFYLMREVPGMVTLFAGGGAAVVATTLFVRNPRS